MQAPLPGTAGIDNPFSASGATSGETVHFILGNKAGSTDVPGCPGQTIDLGNPSVLGTQVADVGGNADIIVPVPADATGKIAGFYSVKLPNCLVSNLVNQTFGGF